MFTLNELLVVALGIGVLLAWFSLSKSMWPEKYFGNADIIAKTMNLRLKDYLIFRYLPVFTVSFLFSLVLQKNTHFPWYLVSFIGIFHAILITVPAIYFNILKRNNKIIVLNKQVLLILHFLTIFLSSSVSLFACYLAQSSVLQKLAPSLEGVRDNIWSVIFVGFVLYFLDRNVIKIERHPFTVKVENSFKMIKQYHEHIVNAAIKNNIDPRLLISIAVLENINRPPWIRNMEKFLWKLKILRSGTVGVMQVKSKKFLSNEESIDNSAIILANIVKEMEGKGFSLEKGMQKYLIQVGNAYQGTEEYGKVLDDVFTVVRMQSLFKDYSPLTIG